MSNEQWSGWMSWNGGSCPCSPTEFVEVKTRDGDIEDGESAAFYWLHEHGPGDIIAYRYRLDDNTMTEEEQELPAKEWADSITDSEEEAEMVRRLADETIKTTIGTLRSKYHVVIKGVQIDVYDVLHAFGVANHADAHAIKKLLKVGQRGYKDANQDREEAIASLKRAIELDSDDEM